MATTKTLTPTNQAITLAAFTEKPDNRTNVTNDDKLADAVNTLNSNFTNQFSSVADFKSYMSAMPYGKTVTFMGGQQITGAVTDGASSSNISGTLSKVASTVVDIMWTTSGGQLLGSSRYDITNDEFININNVNSNINKKGNALYITAASGTSHILTLPNGFKGIVSGFGGSIARQFIAIVDIAVGGAITFSNVYSGSGVTITSDENNKIAINYQSAAAAYIGMLEFTNKDLSTVTLT